MQEFIPPGDARVPETTIDRTMTFDPAQLWPNALSCPDWPYLPGSMRYDGERGRRGAEARLERIAQHLNRGAGLRAPTKAERQEVIGQFFRPGGSIGAVPGVSAAGISSLSNTAELIAEAAHIRGYLRKLDAQSVKEVEGKDRAVRAEAQHTLDGYHAEAPAELAEYRSLAEAEARHLQRIDDEKAFHRRQGLRQHVDTLHSAAVQAAYRLGVAPPPAPKLD